MNREIIATILAIGVAVLTYIIPPVVLGVMVQTVATATVIYFLWEGWGDWAIQQARTLFVKGEEHGQSESPEAAYDAGIAGDGSQHLDQDRSSGPTG